MKRKLALLLAAVMVIAAMPMNVFASSQNSIIKGTNAETATLFYENGTAGNTSGEVDGGGSDYKYWVDGTDLKIVLDDNTYVGRTFTLELENAKWFFRHDDSKIAGSVTDPTPGHIKNVLASTANDVSVSAAPKVQFTVNTAAVSSIAGTYSSADLRAAYILSELATSGKVGVDLATLTASTSWYNTTPVSPANDIQINASSNGSGGFGTEGYTWASAPVLKSKATGLTANNYIVVNDDNAADKAEDMLTDLIEEMINETGAYTDGTTWVATQLTNGTTLFELTAVDSVPTTTASISFNLPTMYYKYSLTATPGSTTTTAAHRGYKFDFPGTGWYRSNSTYNYQTGTVTTDVDGVTGYIGTGGYMDYSATNGKYVYTRLGTIPMNGTSHNTGDQLPYELEVITRGTERIASVIIGANGQKDDILTIPLVMLTTADGDYRVRITSELTEVTGANLLIGQKVDGKTSASVSSVTTRRNDFTIGRLRIKELKKSSIFSTVDWQFELRAPRGYYFASADIYHGDNISNAGDKLSIYAEDGLKWWTGKTGRLPLGSDRVKTSFKESRTGDIDYSIIVVDVIGNTFQKSVSTLGSLYINNLKLVAEDDDTIDFGSDVYITIRNTDESVLTEEDVKVGTATDYDITLTRVKDEIPELVSGRLEGYGTYDTSKSVGAQYNEVTIDDKYHQAAKVKFAERVADAWWAQRNTVFTLPEEVRFMKVQFDKDEIKNLTAGMSSELLKGSNQNQTDGIYYDAGKRLGKVTVDQNTLTLTNLSIVNDKKASFEMDMWLSIQVDFEGEINLVLNNKALKYTESDEDISCQIATAIKPIDVITNVTEAKVGYQYVTVADFEIKETKAGNLLQGETVYVTVTDEISVDMAIAKGFSYAVTEGNIKIKDVQTRSLLGNNMFLNADQGAQLSFKIQRESSVASTIAFTDVQVKIDRSVPYSSLSNTEDRGIDLHVWGPAVAKNYYYLYTQSNGRFTNNMIENDLFTVAGISEKYVNVVTLPTDSNQSEFANHVVVTMGSTTYTINGVEAELEVAPYVSTASNSAMVPLRFVAVALGLPETAVHWDAATSTATVDANTRIVSFTTGSSYYTVNGSMIPMVSPDGLPVEMEITNERAFVPFRALGEAFGIAVNWDAETSSAVYNQPAVQ